MDEYLLSDFFQGESPSVQYTRLERNPGSYKIPWSLINPGDYQLKMGLFLTSDGTRLAFQDAFTDDAPSSSKLGLLTYDSDAIADALGDLTRIDCTFEIQLTDAGGQKIKGYQRAATLRKEFLTDATLSVPLEEVAASQAWTRAICFPKDGTDPANPCDGFLIKSRPSGNPFLITWDDEGTPRATPIT